MVDILTMINKKRNGEELTNKEINYFVKNYTNGKIPDYQASALLMAIYFQGMNDTECTSLTKAMVDSGKTIDLSSISDYKLIDKHSTGGVGDKVSLIALPLVASLEIPIVKMSGRGLGHTGGTIDKLEAIRGFNVNLSLNQIKNHIKNNNNIIIIEQSKNIVPADKKIYSLRDVTGTVNSLPLIASSIMSKKIATGSDGVVIDVKVGSGAFLKTVNEARQLSSLMINIGKKLNIPVIAVLTSMDEPLGREIGNLNEVKEVVRLLKNEEFDNNLMKVSLVIATQMVKISEKFNNKSDQYIADKLKENIANGKAYKKFKDWVESQGGNLESIYDKKYTNKYIIKSSRDGYIDKIYTQKLGELAVKLGAGRMSLDDEIDYHAGITINVKLGDYVEKDQVLLEGRTNKLFDINIENELKSIIKISKNSTQKINDPILEIIK